MSEARRTKRDHSRFFSWSSFFSLFLPKRFGTPLPALGLLFLALSACGPRAFETLGLADPAPLPALAITLYCDASGGSSCTERNLASTLDQVLPDAAARPGTTVRLFMQGEDLGTTRSVESFDVPAPKSPAPRAVRFHRARVASEAKERLLRAYRESRPKGPVRRSPIAEGLGKAALSGEGDPRPRLLVVLTDGREVSRFGDFECGEITPEDAFVRNLAEARVLAPGSLRGARVFFAFFAPVPVEGGRCAVTLLRMTELQSLWRRACREAGAEEVRFTDGPPQVPASPKER